MKINDIVSRFKKTCLNAECEDDIKAAGNIFFQQVADYYSINLSSHNEKTLVNGGRADGVYNDIILEYKDLGVFNRRNGINEAIFGRNEHDRGIYHYLINLSLQNCHNDSNVFLRLLLTKVGIGFDGKQFIICRFREVKDFHTLSYEKTKSLPNNFPCKFPVIFEQSDLLNFEEGVKRLLMYVRSTVRKPLTSSSLCESFSSHAKITNDTILYLYSLLSISLKKNTRIKTLYEEWERIFGTIYDEDAGTDFVGHERAIKKLYGFNNIDSIDVKKALFTLQTYYNIIIKLLINNLLESLIIPDNTTFAIQNRVDLLSLFHGKMGKEANKYIDNFFEIHFFEWFTFAEDLNLSHINNILVELDKFETTVSVIKPEIVEDVLKKTYESIMPRELRHLMGEYYTINWLADFTIEKSKYNFDKDKSFLDPTCGSGTFLTHLIKRYIEQHKADMEYKTLVRHIISNFVGFDINPIAVLQAKANYILSLGDVTKMEKAITIPIYMCDSILVPTVYAKQKDGTDHIDIVTSVGNFRLPLHENRQKSDIFLKTLSNCILTEYTEYIEFKERLKREHNIVLEGRFDSIAKELFDKLLTLHLSGKNGFWPIILKNSFAPLFCKQKFDYVIGNPPWIAWKAMSESYRKLTLDIWLSYGIFEKSAYDKITSHDDFAMAVTYVSIDQYLKNSGKAIFILPQTFVKSLKGGEGFRKLCITRDNLKIPFRILEVHDMTSVNPFKGQANNKTAVYVFKKGLKMEYPMNNYYEYSIKSEQSINPEEPYTIVKDKLSASKLSAIPITKDDIRSPWLTLPPTLIKHLNKYMPSSSKNIQNYKARKGIEPCGAKGIYLVRILEKKENLIKIENLVERSRLKEVIDMGTRQGLVEPDLIYPMVGGRDIDKWGIKSHIHMVVPHNNSGDGIYRGMELKRIKKEFFYTYEWLYNFHDILLDTRIRSGKFFNPKVQPWYRLDNVGQYTFSKYKVLWQEQSTMLKCCVVSTLNDENLEPKTIVTDSKVLFVSLDNEMEAHYLCGILNSKEIEMIVQGYTINTNRGIDIVKNIFIPKFDSKNKLHLNLANASIRAHKAYLEANPNKIKEEESIINTIVSKIY